MSEIWMRVDFDHDAGAIAAVDQGLGAANDAAAALDEVAPIACFARDANGVVIGGAVGRTWGSCCELQQLWTDPAYRRRGVARRILTAFEGKAQQAGCTDFFLETFSFQAPDFYRSMGYSVGYANTAFPHGIVKYHMRKRTHD